MTGSQEPSGGDVPFDTSRAHMAHFLVTEAGIRQFLDIGTGLPSANNTHQVAQRGAPASRVAYVDNDRC